MLLTDLVEVKTYLGIDLCNTSEDNLLNMFIEFSSHWILELLNRGMDLELKSRTEYYNGTGTAYLLLNKRPVFTTPTIQVFVDQNGYWGQGPNAFPSNTQLVYGTDFVLKIDQDNGSSRSGILVNLKRFWQKPAVRQVGFLTPFSGDSFGNVKIVYTAGYTPDTIPSPLRVATNLLVAKMRYLMPLGMELSSDSYEERSISLASQKEYFLTTIKPMILPYRNWKW